MKILNFCLEALKDHGRLVSLDVYECPESLRSLSVCNFAVLIVALSRVQVLALADKVSESFRSNCGGYAMDMGHGEWVVIEGDGVFVHIMNKEIRDTYQIHKLYEERQFFRLDTSLLNF